MEELLEKDMICHYSRNLKKAMVRNSYQGRSLQKDLKHIQRQRNQLVQLGALVGNEKTDVCTACQMR